MAETAATKKPATKKTMANSQIDIIMLERMKDDKIVVFVTNIKTDQPVRAESIDIERETLRVKVNGKWRLYMLNKHILTKITFALSSPESSEPLVLRLRPVDPLYSYMFTHRRP